MVKFHITLWPQLGFKEKLSKAKIVSALGKEFNIDGVYDNESSSIEILNAVDLNPVQVPPSSLSILMRTLIEVCDTFSNLRFLSIFLWPSAVKWP